MEFPSHSSEQHVQIPLPFLASANLLNLSLTACIVYALLLDRCRSSARHPKFIDDVGPFVIYPQEQLANACGCGIAKVRAALRALESASLILTQEQTAANGMRIAPKIYIRHWAPPREAGYPYGPSVAEILAGTLPICTAENVGWGSYDFIQYVIGNRQLSLRARVLYAIIASETRKTSVYAVQNENHSVFCTVDCKELRRLLSCSTDSLTRTFAELESNGIIWRERISTNASMQRIYLLMALPITAKSQDDNSRIECPEPQTRASTAANPDPNQKNNQNNNHNSVITMSNTAETEYVFDIVSSKLNDFYSGESLQRTKDILILAKKYMPKGTSCTSDELLAYVQTVGKKNNIINLESYVKKSINSLQEGGYAAAGKQMKRRYRNNVL